MRFSGATPAWTGFYYDKVNKIDADNVFEYKSMSQDCGKICKYESLQYDIIVVVNDDGRRLNCDWMPDVQFAEKVDMAISKKVGEYPVLVAMNDDNIVNIVLKSCTQYDYVQLEKFIKDVLNCKSVAPVMLYEDLDYDSEFSSVNRYYIPTYKGVPALWCTTVFSVEKIFYVNCERDLKGFNTDIIKKWIKGVESSGLPATANVNIDGFKTAFTYNKHYRRFNGSIQHNVLLYPVFVTIWEDLVRAGYGNYVSDNYKLWLSWFESGGEFVTTFKEKKDKEQPVVADTTSNSLGVWVKKSVETVEEIPAIKEHGINNSRVSELLVMRAVVGGPVLLTVYTQNNQKHTWEFELSTGTKLLGHSIEVANMFIDAVQSNNYNLSEDTVI